jgi:hypothetical protein
MKQDRKFNEILNVCLERLLRGETVEQCLRDYPEQADELKSLLQTAMAVKAASAIQPRSEFKARARNEFQNALRERNAAREKPSPSFRWPWQWQPVWSITLAVLVVLVLSGGGTIAAARNSMPDNPLYSVKLFTENTRLTFAFSDTDKAALNAEFANNRGQEIVYAAAKNDVASVRNTAGNLNTNMSNIAVLTGNTLGENAAQNNRLFSNDTAETGQHSAVTIQDNAVAPEQNIAPQAAPMFAAVPGTTTPLPEGAVTGSGAGAVQEPAPVSKAVVPDESVQTGGDQSTAAAGESPAPAILRHSYGLDKNGSFESSMTDQEKLRLKITDNYNTLQLQLEEALTTASPDIRPIIRQAIAQAQDEYQKAISNLDTLDFINNKRP